MNVTLYISASFDRLSSHRRWNEVLIKLNFEFTDEGPSWLELSVHKPKQIEHFELELKLPMQADEGSIKALLLLLVIFTGVVMHFS